MSGAVFPKRLKFCACLALFLILCATTDEGWAATVRGKRTKVRPAGGETFGIGADESVAEQVNDPTSFLREVGMDVGIEHGEGSKHTIIEWTPRLALPLTQRFRFEAGVPLFANGPGERDDMELGDIYASLAYIFASTRSANYLADVRVDLPTGNESRQAGLNVAQWHAALGSVVYAFQDQGFLLIPWLEYRRSMFEDAESYQVSSLIGSLGVVYLLSENSYLRGEGTVNFDAARGWRDSATLGLEIGRVFSGRYSVAVGYEFDLWGDAEIRNAANVSLGYLF